MIIQCIVNSFRSQMLQGQHDLLTDTLKIALYTGNATLGPMTTVYTTDGEASGSGYTAGGITLTGATINSALSNATVTYNAQNRSSATGSGYTVSLTGGGT